MLDAIRVKLLGRHRVEPLRHVPVALFELRPEPPRPQADGIGGEANEATIFLNPKLELRFELEDAQIDRHAELCAVARKTLIETGKVWGARQRLSGAEAGLVVRARPVDVRAVDELSPARPAVVLRGACLTSPSRGSRQAQESAG